MFTCRQWDKRIDDYVAGRMGPMRRFIFRVHFILCPPCKKYLDEYRRTLEAAHRQAEMDATAPPPLPPALAESLVKSLCEHRRRQD